MRFSVFTVSLPEWTPEEAVEHLAALGYDGVEWRVIDQPQSDGPPGFWSGNRCTLPLRTLAADAPRVRALAAGAGLAVPNLGTYVSCLDPDAVDRALVGAAAVGAPSIRVQVPNYDGREPYLPLRDSALAAFDDVTGFAARHGVRALVEIHMGTIVPSASAAAQFCSRFDARHVGVIHDAGNMGYGMQARLAQCRRTSHVHLKNALGAGGHPGRRHRPVGGRLRAARRGERRRARPAPCVAGSGVRRLDLVRGLLDRPPAAGADSHQPRGRARPPCRHLLTGILGPGPNPRPEPL